MMKWIRSLIVHQSQVQQHIENMWEVSIDEEAWLHIPVPFAQPEQWATWGKMQAKILSRFQQHWSDTHPYIRFHTYLPEHFSDILELDQYVEDVAASEEGHIFLFPDCRNEYIWETILGSAGLVPCARAIFILDHKPPNWQEVMASLFDIAQNLSGRYLSDETESVLSTCHCLCYSMDEDLIIAKVDLPESTVLSILEDIAKEEGLQLLLHRRT